MDPGAVPGLRPAASTLLRPLIVADTSLAAVSTEDAQLAATARHVLFGVEGPLLMVEAGGAVLAQSLIAGSISQSHIIDPADVAPSLPFDDDAFEAVVCRGVLEHLPAERVAGMLDELGRIARRFVLVAVPYAPRDAVGFDISQIFTWRASGAALREVVLTGDLLRPGTVDRAAAAAAFAAGRFETERSAAVAVFTNEALETDRWEHLSRRSRRSLLLADFTDPLQATDEFAAGTQWSHWRAGSAMAACEHGLVAEGAEAGSVEFVVAQPCAGGACAGVP